MDPSQWEEKWVGIHPHRWSFGWVVATDPTPPLSRGAWRYFTRKGAERAARRRTQRSADLRRWEAESGVSSDVPPYLWRVIGKIRDHPGRRTP